MKEEDNKSSLGDFIKRIKTEGVDEATRLGDEIVAEARKKADEIVTAAKEEAQSILASADGDIKEREAQSKRSIDMALRDALLQLQNSMEGLLDGIVKKEFGDAVKGEALERVLLKVVEAWKKNPDAEAGIEVLLSEKEMESLSRGFMASLKKMLKEGVELKVHPGIKAGFRVAEKEGSMHYDFTDEAISELLSRYLKEELRAVLGDMRKGTENAG